MTVQIAILFPISINIGIFGPVMTIYISFIGIQISRSCSCRRGPKLCNVRSYIKIG